MSSLALLFTLSAIGISETVFLIRRRLAAQTPVCLIGGSCTHVLESDWSRVFVIPTDILGLIFYTTTALLTAFMVVDVGEFYFWRMSLNLCVGVGAFMSFFFTYLQWRIIHSWCFWCLMSAATIWLMGIIILIS